MTNPVGNPYPSGFEQLILVSPNMVKKKVNPKKLVHLKAKLSPKARNNLFLDKDFLKANKISENAIKNKKIDAKVFDQLVAMDKRSFQASYPEFECQ